MLNAESNAAIVGVNEDGYEDGNEVFTTNISLPWLQDDKTNVWRLWDVNYRDVYVVSSDARLFDVYNLSEHDLRDSDAFEDLKTLILSAE